MGERDQMVFAPLALAVINGLEHGVEPTGGEGRMPNRPAEIWRAPFAHLGFAARLPRLMQLRMDPHQGHQLIGIGEVSQVGALRNSYE